MKTNINNALITLRRELQYLDSGGYRSLVGSRQPLFCMETDVHWRQPRFFEDSPSCPKPRHCPCDPKGNCVLLDFVPPEHRQETIPCRHIPLNERRETIASLYPMASNREIESKLRSWLLTTIRELEQQMVATLEADHAGEAGDREIEAHAG